jgi:anti-sigma factor RsiW
VSGANCGEYRELVSAFVDEQLEGADLLRLKAHLESCPECRALEAGLRRFSALVRAAEVLRPHRRPPPGFAAAVAARAVSMSPATAVPFPGPRAARPIARGAWIGMAAAAAVAALLFSWSWQRLLPGDAAGRRVAGQVTPASVELASANRPVSTDEGDIDSWMSEHAMLARAGTLLGPAEEIEFASFHAGAIPER